MTVDEIQKLYSGIGKYRENLNGTIYEFIDFVQDAFDDSNVFVRCRVKEPYDLAIGESLNKLIFLEEWRRLDEVKQVEVWQKVRNRPS